MIAAMTDDRSLLAECVEALIAARPFVVDGRDPDSAADVLGQVDAALKRHGVPTSSLNKAEQSEQNQQDTACG
jgi:hypothetical protein